MPGKDDPSDESITNPSHYPLPSSSLQLFVCYPTSAAGSEERRAARTAPQHNSWLAKPQLAGDSMLHPHTEPPVTSTETQGSSSSSETFREFSKADGRGTVGLVTPDLWMWSVGSTATSHGSPHCVPGDQHRGVWGQEQDRVAGTLIHNDAGVSQNKLSLNRSSDSFYSKGQLLVQTNLKKTCLMARVSSHHSCPINKNLLLLEAKAGGFGGNTSYLSYL